MASPLGIAFQLSASSTGMAQGINAGVVELQKLGLAAKRTAGDVATLKTLEISKAFISGISSIANTFQSFTSGALNAIDNTRQLAASLGVSYQELRTLQVAADLSGASSEELAKAFTRAQITITQAAGGSKEAAKALATLGLSVDDLATQTSTQQFQTIAAAINSIENPAQRAAAAVAIFGKAGATLLPTFRELPENLKTAQTFLGGFRDGVNGINPDKIDAIGDSFGLAGQAMQELAGRVLTQLQPALTQATDNFIKFVQSIDVPAAARTLATLLTDVGNALAFVGRFAKPLAENLLPAIGGYLAFINRQAIASAVTGLASAFAASARAAIGYSAAAGAAATATVGLGVAIRSLLTSTGIGALVVVLGLAAGALLEWAIASDSAGADSAAAIAEAKAEMERLRLETNAAGAAAFNLGEEVKQALKVPEQISINEFAQGSLNEARSAIVSLAKELGGLDKVPAEVLANFDKIREYAAGITDEVADQAKALQSVDQNSKALIATTTELARRERDKADAIKEAADAAKKSAEESRKRVVELQFQGLSARDKAEIQLDRDLLAIENERIAAQAALADAQKNADRDGIRAAQIRLRYIQSATDEAKAQARVRRLEARGIDQNLIGPTQTLEDQLRAIRDAFDAGDLNFGEARSAFRKLTDEGRRIRDELRAELSKPAQRALEINDIRTQQGASQFLAMATGRQDPAIEQRAQQLAQLKQINDSLRRLNLPVIEI